MIFTLILEIFDYHLLRTTQKKRDSPRVPIKKGCSTTDLVYRSLTDIDDAAELPHMQIGNEPTDISTVGLTSGIIVPSDKPDTNTHPQDIMCTGNK